MFLRIICNVITIAACFISCLFTVIRMATFPKTLEKRLKKVKSSYVEDKINMSESEHSYSEEYFTEREKFNCFIKLVYVNFTINLVCLIVSVVCCCFDGIPFKSSVGEELAYLIVVITGVIFTIINIAYYNLQIKRFSIPLRPYTEKFNFASIHSHADIKQTASGIGCVAAFIVGWNIAAAAHVIFYLLTL